MASYTYPVARPEGQLSAEQIHLILSSPRLLAKRIAALIDQRFIADYLLTGRYQAVGGAILYETGEEIFTADSPEAVEPGGSYPKTVLTTGEVAAAKTTKWGIETDITDEKISREGMTHVNRGLTRLGNSVVRQVDSVAWGVIASKVSATSAASAAWTSPAAIVQSLLTAAAQSDDLSLGLNPSVIALSTLSYAKVIGTMVNANVLPREAGNPIVNGQYPVNLLGYTWVTSPHITGTDPWLFDVDQLGGMADEKLDSPDYASAGDFGVEARTGRHKDDKYELRARRVTVPVVTEPLAGRRITGTGL